MSPTDLLEAEAQEGLAPTELDQRVLDFVVSRRRPVRGTEVVASSGVGIVDALVSLARLSNAGALVRLEAGLYTTPASHVAASA